MSFPFLLRKLFENDGAGEKLNPAIIPTDTALSDTSTNPIANSVVKAAIDAKSFPVDSALSTTSTNAVQNKVINSALASKVNISALATVATSGSYSDLSNKPTIPASGSVVTLVSSSYDSTTGSWYRKWSDGYIEQGGIRTNSTKGLVTLSFGIPFSNTNYIFLRNSVFKTSDTTTNLYDVGCQTKTLTAVTFYETKDNSMQAMWLAVGY